MIIIFIRKFYHLILESYSSDINFLKGPSTMTTISVEIPKLAVGQTVEAWKSLFEAATGSLKPEQRIALLPNYIDRTPGDHEVAKLGAQEDTLQAAFVVIETLIDGERTKYKSVNEFCDIKPKDDLQSLYFKLKKIGKLAGLCNSFVFTRFLGLIPRGKKFFRDNEAEIDKETYVETIHQTKTAS